MKICSSCKVNKETSDFYVNHRTKDSHSYSCKECQALKSKLYRAKNKDKISNGKRKWYDANKVEVLQYQASYYEANLAVISICSHSGRKTIVQRVIRYNSKIEV